MKIIQAVARAVLLAPLAAIAADAGTGTRGLSRDRETEGQRDLIYAFRSPAQYCHAGSGSAKHSQIGKGGKGGKGGHRMPSREGICLAERPDGLLPDDTTGVRYWDATPPTGNAGNACGETFDGPVYLDGPVFCKGDDGLTLDGPYAVLDCQHNTIFSGDDFGIRLMNGATVRNCKVSGFDIGIQMLEGDNLVENTKVIGSRIGITMKDGNNYVRHATIPGTTGNDGIQLDGNGCNTIENTSISGSGEDGIEILNTFTGNLVLNSVKITGSDEDGFIFIDDSSSGDALSCATTPDQYPKIFVIDSEISFNGDDGVEWSSKVCGNLELYGTNTFEGNDDGGIEAEHTGTLVFNGETLLLGNTRSGLELGDSTDITFAYYSKTAICGNGNDIDDEADINIESDFDGMIRKGGALICDNVQDTRVTEIMSEVAAFATEDDESEDDRDDRRAAAMTTTIACDYQCSCPIRKVSKYHY
mmetsp:Transcript_10374/g.21994  ORF Transcript_10374/g.21994 Transcript_10374/m.21994 type:complete len:473 (+) Transcript_10374:70-1488(+)